MQNTALAVTHAQGNPVDIFFARVRAHKEQGLRPAGQVYPPPTKQEKKEAMPFEYPTGYS